MRACAGDTAVLGLRQMDVLTASTSHFDRRGVERAARAERDFDQFIEKFNGACEAECSARASRDAGEAQAPPAFAEQLNAATASALADWPAPAPDPSAASDESAFFACAVLIEQQARVQIAVASLLRRADRSSLPMIRPVHQRSARRSARAARRAQDQISGFLHARLRAQAHTTLARLQRAGRSRPGTSAGPTISDS